MTYYLMVRVGHAKETTDVKRAIRRALSFLNSRGKTIILKPEHETAKISLLRGEDVLPVLPTGFGKCMIFTLFTLSARVLNRPLSVLVICPFKSMD